MNSRTLLTDVVVVYGSFTACNSSSSRQAASAGLVSDVEPHLTLRFQPDKLATVALSFPSCRDPNTGIAYNIYSGETQRTVHSLSYTATAADISNPVFKIKIK